MEFMINYGKSSKKSKLKSLHCQLLNHFYHRKNDAIQQRKAIMDSQYIENEISFLVNNIKKLMQSELNRHTRTIFLVNSYYAALANRMPPSSFELTALEIADVNMTPIDLIDTNNMHRLLMKI